MLLFDRYVYFEHALCCEAIRDGSTDFSFAANNFKIFFRSVFNNDVGVQFLINLNQSWLISGLLSKEFYYGLPLWCRTLFVSFNVITDFKREPFNSFQNASKNSLLNPSFPGALILDINLKALTNYFSPSSISQKYFCILYIF